MAAIREDQKDRASRFMSALWNELIKPYYNPVNTDEFWSEIVKKENELIERFDLESEKLLLEMMWGFTAGLEMKAGVERVRSVEERLRHREGD